MKVLVVDDDKYILKVISHILEEENFQVYISGNGNEALNVVNQNPDIKLIITDIIMPEKEGIETIIELKSKYPDIKIIAMSGGGRLNPKGYLMLAKKFGAEAVLTKPFDNMELINSVNEVLGKFVIE